MSSCTNQTQEGSVDVPPKILVFEPFDLLKMLSTSYSLLPPALKPDKVTAMLEKLSELPYNSQTALASGVRLTNIVRQIGPQSGDRQKHLGQIISGIGNMFGIMLRNYPITYAPADPEERKKFYDGIAKGYTYIAEKVEAEMQSSDFDKLKAYESLKKIGQAGHICARAWCDALEDAIAAYVPQEAPTPLDTFTNFFYQAREDVARRLSEDIIKLYHPALANPQLAPDPHVARGNFTHYVNFYTAYINKQYSLGLAKLVLQDAMLEREAPGLEATAKNHLAGIDMHHAVIYRVFELMADRARENQEFREKTIDMYITPFYNQFLAEYKERHNEDYAKCYGKSEFLGSYIFDIGGGYTICPGVCAAILQHQGLIQSQTPSEIKTTTLAKCKDFALISQLIDYKKEKHQASDLSGLRIQASTGTIPLLNFLCMFNKPIAMKLIQSGSNVNVFEIAHAPAPIISAPCKCRQPIHIATQIGDPELVKMLLQKDANPFITASVNGRLYTSVDLAMATRAGQVFLPIFDGWLQKHGQELSMRMEVITKGNPHKVTHIPQSAVLFAQRVTLLQQLLYSSNSPSDLSEKMTNLGLKPGSCICPFTKLFNFGGLEFYSLLDLAYINQKALFIDSCMKLALDLRISTSNDIYKNQLSLLLHQAVRHRDSALTKTLLSKGSDPFELIITDSVGTRKSACSLLIEDYKSSIIFNTATLNLFIKMAEATGSDQTLSCIWVKRDTIKFSELIALKRKLEMAITRSDVEAMKAMLPLIDPNEFMISQPASGSSITVFEAMLINPSLRKLAVELAIQKGQNPAIDVVRPEGPFIITTSLLTYLIREGYTDSAKDIVRMLLSKDPRALKELINDPETNPIHLAVMSGREEILDDFAKLAQSHPDLFDVPFKTNLCKAEIKFSDYMATREYLRTTILSGDSLSSLYEQYDLFASELSHPSVGACSAFDLVVLSQSKAGIKEMIDLALEKKVDAGTPVLFNGKKVCFLTFLILSGYKEEAKRLICSVDLEKLEEDDGKFNSPNQATYPLIAATEIRDQSSVQLLLEKGLDPFFISICGADNEGISAFDLAYLNKDDVLINCFIQWAIKEKLEYIHFHPYQGRSVAAPLFSLLMELGKIKDSERAIDSLSESVLDAADFDGFDYTRDSVYYGIPPAFYLCAIDVVAKSGNADIAEKLLQRGIDPFEASISVSTQEFSSDLCALNIAIINGHEQLAIRFMEHAKAQGKKPVISTKLTADKEMNVFEYMNLREKIMFSYQNNEQDFFNLIKENINPFSIDFSCSISGRGVGCSIFDLAVRDGKSSIQDYCINWAIEHNLNPFIVSQNGYIPLSSRLTEINHPLKEKLQASLAQWLFGSQECTEAEHENMCEKLTDAIVTGDNTTVLGFLTAGISPDATPSSHAKPPFQFNPFARELSLHRIDNEFSAFEMAVDSNNMVLVDAFYKWATEKGMNPTVIINGEKITLQEFRGSAGKGSAVKRVLGGGQVPPPPPETSTSKIPRTVTRAPER